MPENLHKKFDVSDVEAEMKAKKKQPEAVGLMARIKEKLGRGSKPEIKTTKNIQELSSAGILLDQQKLAEARKKIQLAEGTGEVELSEEDLEEVEPEDLTHEAEETN
ncbi:MAG: hypothetical protein G01um101413_619 [Parcubacteria group bacterium Gr01-1014_13]|nr:MAG: hypothetical protein G01um101413_619 [Parcubacteria group bacterium Gr01-1014_13]